MNKVLHTRSLEHKKSQYLIDLVKHDSGKHFIRIVQSVNEEGKFSKSEIGIRPSLVRQMILTLQELHEQVPKSEYEKGETLSPARTKKIVESYLKNVSIKDLMLGNDCSEEDILQILRNASVAITEEKLPKSKRRMRRR